MAPHPLLAVEMPYPLLPCSMFPGKIYFLDFRIHILGRSTKRGYYDMGIHYQRFLFLFKNHRLHES